MAMARRLTKRQQNRIYRLYMQGKSVKEISRIMKRKYGTIHQYVGGDRNPSNDIFKLAKFYRVPVEEIDDLLVVVIP